MKIRYLMTACLFLGLGKFAIAECPKGYEPYHLPHQLKCADNHCYNANANTPVPTNFGITFPGTSFKDLYHGAYNLIKTQSIEHKKIYYFIFADNERYDLWLYLQPDEYDKSFIDPAQYDITCLAPPELGARANKK